AQDDSARPRVQSARPLMPPEPALGGLVRELHPGGEERTRHIRERGRRHEQAGPDHPTPMLPLDPAPYILHVRWEATERIQRHAPSLRPAPDTLLPPRHAYTPYELIKYQRLHLCRVGVCR